MKKEILSNIKNEEFFSVAGIKFIKIFEDNGKTVAVAKESVGNWWFGEHNNFADSRIKKALEGEILPKLEEEIGAENIVEHEVDLTSANGSHKEGKVKCKISLPTLDFYRKNVKIFDKYKLYKRWWLATPYYTDENIPCFFSCCVATDLHVFCVPSRFDAYVRPFVVFISSIPVYCWE